MFTSVHTSDRSEYFREYRRKQRAEIKAKAVAPEAELFTSVHTGDTIKSAWNAAPIAERDSFMTALGLMRDLRDDFTLRIPA